MVCTCFLRFHRLPFHSVACHLTDFLSFYNLLQESIQDSQTKTDSFLPWLWAELILWFSNVSLVWRGSWGRELYCSVFLAPVVTGAPPCKSRLGCIYAASRGGLFLFAWFENLKSRCIPVWILLHLGCRNTGWSKWKGADYPSSFLEP